MPGEQTKIYCGDTPITKIYLGAVDVSGVYLAANPLLPTLNLLLQETTYKLLTEDIDYIALNEANA